MQADRLAIYRGLRNTLLALVELMGLRPTNGDDPATAAPRPRKLERVDVISHIQITEQSAESPARGASKLLHFPSAAAQRFAPKATDAARPGNCIAFPPVGPRLARAA